MNFKYASLGKRRQKDILLMALGLAVLFVGMPFGVYFINNYNSILADDYAYLDRVDFEVNEAGDPPNIYVVSSVGSVNVQENILWNNATHNHTMILTEGLANPILEIYFVTKYTISDMIANNMNEWKIDLIGSGPSAVVSMFTYDPGASWDGDDSSNVSQNYAGERTDMFRMDHDHNTSFKASVSSLDLLAHKVQYGDGRVIICLKSQDFIITGSMVAVGTANWDPGDIIEFKYGYVVYSEGAVSGNTVLEIGGAVLGVIFLLIGLMSTTWWNPTEKNNPGPIDRWTGRLFGWVRRKADGKKRRG